MMSMLRVKELWWHVSEVPILENVAFDVAPGEFVALMGRNGAGKSTLLDLVAGLRRPTRGAVLIDGLSLDEWAASDLARLVSHLPQIVRTDVSFTVEQLALMGRYPHADRWFESEADHEAVTEALRRCDCLSFRRRRIHTLSGGERQRVLLAACLAQQAKLLLFDEPATYLDVDQQLHCFSILREEADRGAACIAVTHDINLALTFCTRIVVLAERTVARDVSTADALEHPEWLRLFSSRLDITTTPAGRPWVWYQ
jgi:iron complex transport system ATP-binding protein